MPVFGLQKGEIFTATDVSCLTWNSSSTTVSSRFFRCHSANLAKNSPRRVIAGHFYKENIVIAAYGTQMTLHQHQCRNTTTRWRRNSTKCEKRSKEKEQILLDFEPTPKEKFHNINNVRKLSLTLKFPPNGDSESHNEET